MTSAVWSRPAERSLEAYLDDLAEYDVRTAWRARRDIHAIADQTARMPGLARRSQRWPGRYERSVLDLKKLLVLRLDGGLVRVVAFLDARQDLDAIDLPTE